MEQKSDDFIVREQPGVYLNLMMSYSGHYTKEGIKYENSVYFKIGKSQNLDARGDRLVNEYDAKIIPICYILTNGFDRSNLESKLLRELNHLNLNLIISDNNKIVSHKKETFSIQREVIQKFMDIVRHNPEYTFLKSEYIENYHQFVNETFISNINYLVNKYFYEESEYTILNDMHSHAINKSMIRDAKTFVENYQFEEYYSSDEDEYDDPDDSDYVDDPDDDDPDDSDFEP
jgi:hypothetical protein